MAKTYRQLTEEIYESVDQLDELKKSTMKRYFYKAAKDGERAENEGDTKRADRRYRGMDRAEEGMFKKRLKKEEVETLVDIIAEGLDLNEEQLQELKKSTLASYVKKAGTERDDAQYNMGKIEGSGDTDDNKQHRVVGDIKKHPHKASWNQLQKHSEKRVDGINRAVRKLAKEEFEYAVGEMMLDIIESFAADTNITPEQLDELKRSTLASYVKKSYASSSNLNHRMDNAEKAISKGHGDIKHLARLGGKAYGRMKGQERALKRLAKEDVELITDTILEHVEATPKQLQELKAETLQRYSHKSLRDIEKRTDRVNSGRGNVGAEADKIGKRRSGIKAARRRLQGEAFMLMDFARTIFEEVGEDLTEEQLNELSYKTVKGYMKKVRKEPGTPTPNRALGKHRALKRIEKARDLASVREELVSEFVGIICEGQEITEEQLQELSKNTLFNYTTKAAVSLNKAKTSWRSGHRRHHTMLNNIEKNRGMSSEGESPEHRKKRNNLWNKTRKHGDTMVKRARGLDRAHARLTREEVEAVIDLMPLDLSEEQLNELKSDTLKSYLNKRWDKYNEPGEAKKLAGTKKGERHTRGVGRAFNKLVGREKKTVKEETSPKADSSTTDNQLVELRSKTLHSYIKKAKADRKDLDTARYDADTNWRAKSAKRSLGIGAAMKKLEKRGENIDKHLKSN